MPLAAIDPTTVFVVSAGLAVVAIGALVAALRIVVLSKRFVSRDEFDRVMADLVSWRNMALEGMRVVRKQGETTKRAVDAVTEQTNDEQGN